MKKQNEEKLATWKHRLEVNKTAYDRRLRDMEWYEKLYLGDKTIRSVDGGKSAKKATHVRNVVAEMVESQVSSAIPQPKVTARRKEDEELARLIEDMLRNELDRLPFEAMNDQDERTAPLQGGDLFLVEWDNGARTRQTVGELAVSIRHPKQFIPQDGVFSSVADMDYWFLILPQTKGYIKRKYGVDVEAESEEMPEAKGDADSAEDMVNQVLAYHRGDKGQIGLFSWVNDQVLDDMDDYQARRLKRCTKCDMPGDGEKCAYCGGTAFRESSEEFEELYEDVRRSDGSVIPAFSERLESTTDAYGNRADSLVQEPTRVPYYKPDVYPAVLRKNVSLFGCFLGDSDAAKISDQQEELKRLSTKMNEKLMKGGSIITAPDGLPFAFEDGELRIVRLENPAQKGMIDTLSLEADISGDMAYSAQMYEEARQITGITDSFQGRRDTTATSGKAKEFSAAQTAGRLDSKRTMKNAAYADLFEVMFKFKLAYCDEPRPVVAEDNQGNAKYREFYKWDFLKQDASGEYYWDDDFLFSTDEAATLATDRQAMWQETRMNFQQGSYGPPTEPRTLIRFWSRMAALHYPGAADTKDELEQELQEQQQMQQQQIGMQGQMSDGLGQLPEMGGMPNAMPGM